MKKFLYSLILLVLMSSLVLAGCTRSATKGGGGELPTSTSSIPFPVGPNSNPNRMTEIVSATQTASVLPAPGLQENTPESGNVSTIPSVVEATQVPTLEPTRKTNYFYTNRNSREAIYLHITTRRISLLYRQAF